MNGEGNRELIFDSILHSPGLSRSDLCRIHDLGWGTVEYHVHSLQRDGSVVVFPYRGRRLLFEAGFDGREMRWMAALRSRVAEDIILRLTDHKNGVRVQKLADELGVSRKIIGRHIEAMHEAGLVARGEHQEIVLRRGLWSFVRRLLDGRRGT